MMNKIINQDIQLPQMIIKINPDLMNKTLIYQGFIH